MAGEIGFIVFMIYAGAHNLAMLPSLGWRQASTEWVGAKLVHTAGDNSVLILLYGVCTLVLCAVFVLWWDLAIRSAYKAQCLAGKNGHAPSLLDDIHTLLNEKANILFLALPTLGILIFTVLPLIFMISMAFTSYDHNHLVLFDWVGFENFKTVFSNSGSIVSARLFMSVLGWTLIWAFFATFLNFFCGLLWPWSSTARPRKARASGVPSSRCRSPFRSSCRCSSCTRCSSPARHQPHLHELGLDQRSDAVLHQRDPARVTVIVINLWVGIPYTIMQVTGILQNIPADQYEAAEIDGANWWQIFTKITMPYIIFVLTPYLITTFTGNVNNFNVIYLLTRGEPSVVGDSAGKTDLLITWLYKLTVDNNDYNLGAVIGIMTFIVLAVVSLITYRSSGSYKNEEAFR